jgi:hypothetical protein
MDKGGLHEAKLRYEQLPTSEGIQSTLQGTVLRSVEVQLSVNSYDERRQSMKLGHLNSAMLFFQSTVGISWFTLHQPLSKVGLYLGFLVTLLVCYITAYGLLKLDKTARLAENDNLRQYRIKNAEELCNMIPYSYMPTVKWLMMIAGLGMMISSSVSYICAVGIFSRSSLGSRESLRSRSNSH